MAGRTPSKKVKKERGARIRNGKKASSKRDRGNARCAEEAGPGVEKLGVQHKSKTDRPAERKQRKATRTRRITRKAKWRPKPRRKGVDKNTRSRAKRCPVRETTTKESGKIMEGESVKEH